MHPNKTHQSVVQIRANHYFDTLTGLQLCTRSSFLDLLRYMTKAQKVRYIDSAICRLTDRRTERDSASLTTVSAGGVGSGSDTDVGSVTGSGSEVCGAAGSGSGSAGTCEVSGTDGSVSVMVWVGGSSGGVFTASSSDGSVEGSGSGDSEGGSGSLVAETGNPSVTYTNKHNQCSTKTKYSNTHAK